MQRIANHSFWHLLLIGGMLLGSVPHASGEMVGPVEGSPLFAGLDSSFSFSRPPVNESALRSELVGVIIDGRETGTELVYRIGGEFFLPAELLDRMSVRGSARNGRLFLETPGGEVQVDASFFREIEGQIFFGEDLLDEVLKVRWEFLPEKYAFAMTLPWWQLGIGSVDLYAGQDALDLDAEPSSFGLTQIRLDHTLIADANTSFSYSNLLLRGRLAEGVWRGEIIRQEDRDIRAQDYYWLKDFDHVQTLVGNQQVLINPLLPAVETTGAQTLYSSKKLEFDPYQDQTRSQYIRRFGIPTKEIEGFSQPGAIAELRINERPVARVRVNLDGTYRFTRVRVHSLQFQTIKVHILDQRSYVELDVQDFTRTPIDLLLDQGQTVAFAGAGANVNPLDPVLGTKGESAFGLMRYGLTDRLTLEAGIQSASGQQHQVLGFTASFGQRWATTMSYGNHEGSPGYSVDFYGRGDRWQLTTRSQDFSGGFRSRLSPESTYHDLRYEYWLTPRISVGAQGRSVRSNSRSKDYLLPGFSWRFNQRNIIRVWPDYDGGYRVDVRTVHRKHDRFEFVHDSSGDQAEYRYFQNASLEIFGRLKNHTYDDATIAELGSIWYPNRFDDRSLLAASVLAGDAGFGYRFAWETTVLPGLFSRLELRDEPLETEFADPGLQLRWTVSVDLSISGGRPIPARNDFVQGRLGSIGGRLMLDDGASLKSEGVEQVAVLINGRPHTAVVRGRHFFVRNIPPGTYEVALGAEYLPMALSPEKITYRVRVIPAATTPVDFMIRHEYGISGRVTDLTGVPLVAVRVEARDLDGNLIRSVLSDAYGYYRFSGFAAGDYLLRIAGGEEVTGDHRPAAERAITIEDGFIFDADLAMAVTPGPESRVETP